MKIKKILAWSTGLSCIALLYSIPFFENTVKAEGFWTSNIAETTVNIATAIILAYFIFSLLDDIFDN